MDMLLFKLFEIAVILLVAWIGGSLPIRLGVTSGGRTLLMYGSAFAAGVFLAAGLIHLLGDGQEYFSAILPDLEFPLAFLICGLGFLLVLSIEKVMAAGEENVAGSTKRPYMLLLILSVHSIIAGTSLGLEGSLATSMLILIAILAHKGFAAFALGISFVEAKLAKAQYYKLLLFFSAMTPLGVAVGAVLSNYLQSEAAIIFEAIFDSLAAGTFLYVATLDMMHETFAQREARWGKFFVLAAGFGLMAVLALWT